MPVVNAIAAYVSPPPSPPDRTPLHIAAERGHALVVEILADKFKASVMDRTKDGSTLMHIASLNGHPEAVMAFLRKGVPLHMPNKASGARLDAMSHRRRDGMGNGRLANRLRFCELAAEYCLCEIRYLPLKQN